MIIYNTQITMRFIKIKILFYHKLFFLHFTLKTISYKIGLLKYNGGGDWYANPTALTNLIEFCNSEIGTNINPVMMK